MKLLEKVFGFYSTRSASTANYRVDGDPVAYDSNPGSLTKRKWASVVEKDRYTLTFPICEYARTRLGFEAMTLLLMKRLLT